MRNISLDFRIKKKRKNFSTEKKKSILVKLYNICIYNKSVKSYLIFVFYFFCFFFFLVNLLKYIPKFYIGSTLLVYLPLP